MIHYAARAPLPPPPPHPASMAAPPTCARVIIKRMADAICEMAGAGEPITTEALQSRDFSPALVLRFGEAARAEARRRWTRRI